MQEFDFSTVSLDKITTEFILSKIDQATIFTYYHGPFKLGQIYKSVFRTDKTPSAGFYVNRIGNLTYHDFKTREKLDCWAFVGKMFGLDFKNSVMRVACDFGFCKEASKVSKKVFETASEVDLDAKRQTKIQFEPAEWNKKNSLFWREGTITIDELRTNEIFVAKRLFVNNKEIYSKGHYRYVMLCKYVTEQGEWVTGVKVYSPTDTSMKWLSNIPLHIPWGLQNLQYKSEKCAIIKSKKDGIIARRYFPDVIELQNESPSAFSPELRTWIKGKFKEPFLILGADPHAVEVCKSFNSEGFGYFNTPKKDYEEYEIEDLFDYCKHYSEEKLIELFKQKNFL